MYHKRFPNMQNYHLYYRNQNLKRYKFYIKIKKIKKYQKKDYTWRIFKYIYYLIAYQENILQNSKKCSKTRITPKYIENHSFYLFFKLTFHQNMWRGQILQILKSFRHSENRIFHLILFNPHFFMCTDLEGWEKKCIKEFFPQNYVDNIFSIEYAFSVSYAEFMVHISVKDLENIFQKLLKENRMKTRRSR